MASSSQSSKFVINFHRGGSFNVVKNGCVVHINLSSSVFELNEADGSDSDLEDDRYDYFSEDDSDIASVDHFSYGEEVFEIRNQKATPKPRKKPSKMIDTAFLIGIYNALDREEYVDKDSDKIIEDQDMVGDQFPIYDPSIKWKLMKSVIVERYESLDQLKRDLVVYALAKGYKLYLEAAKRAGEAGTGTGQNGRGLKRAGAQTGTGSNGHSWDKWAT
nr:hypothetical protein [Tanacetum cinerariifolium]